jgi:hypothetical protein
MLKNFVRFESIVNEKIGELYVEFDTPTIVVREMLKQYEKALDHIEEQAKLAQEEKEKQEVASICEDAIFERVEA